MPQHPLLTVHFPPKECGWRSLCLPIDVGTIALGSLISHQFTIRGSPGTPHTLPWPRRACVSAWLSAFTLQFSTGLVTLPQSLF